MAKIKYSPIEAIRAFCVQCQGSSYEAVINCNDLDCVFYAYRRGKTSEHENTQPVKAIRKYCHVICQCGAGSDEVKNCQGDKAALGPCPVFPFRMGRNPNIKPETREKRRQTAYKMTKKGTFGFSKVNVPGAS